MGYDFGRISNEFWTQIQLLDEAVGIRDRIQQLKAQSKPELKD
jgi:hypothetical protein